MIQYSIKGNLIDIPNNRISAGEIVVLDGRIHDISYFSENKIDPQLPFISPGFIDAHVHIESAMLIPSEFARLAVVHGTVSTVSDPHEIANVCGMEGVRFMINNGKKIPFKFNFGAPSCVPATLFETAGSELNSDDVKKLLEEDDIKYLSEMMNFPGAIQGDAEVINKITAAFYLDKPVDGHAPGLSGSDLRTYIARGISTDHECFTLEEALEKISLGMKIIIREGSAAKNFEELIPLIGMHHDMIMFCSDDKHPDSLAIGHINKLCARAVKKGYDLFKILQAACINPVYHYKLNVGLLNVGDAADFILIEDLIEFNIIATYINGEKVAEKGMSLIERVSFDESPINNFNIEKIGLDDLRIVATSDYPFPIIDCLDGQLITNKLKLKPKEQHNLLVSDISIDVLKIVVVNRYNRASVAKAFIHGFDLKQGAIASSVAHDSHNIVAVGVDDESILHAVNLIIESKGGISCVGNDNESILPLPIAGLMSDDDGYTVAERYTKIDQEAKLLGSLLSAPFMSLSFMALLVIPHIKLSDKGLFNGDTFQLFSQGNV